MKFKTIYCILLGFFPLALWAQTSQSSGSTASGTTMTGTYYADRFVGRKTAGGDVFRQNQYTAAHRSYPMGTYLLVINHYTDQQVVVRVNDRCPVSGVLDMTKLAVHQLGIKGSRKVEVRILDDDEGYRLWAAQDTLAMTEDEYYAYRDRSPHKRISPYPIRPGGAVLAEASTPVRRKNTKPTKAEKTSEAVADNSNEVVEKPVRPTVVTASEVVVEDTCGESGIPLKDRRYDLELCVVNSHKAAMKEISRLPHRLQEKVTLEYNQRSQQVRIILTLADTRSHVVRTQAMILEDFPDSYLILHHQKK